MAVRISSRTSAVKCNTSTAQNNYKVSSNTKTKSSSKGSTTKEKTTSKAKSIVPTKFSNASTKQTTTYLRDAPKMYTSSGTAYSYARPAQSYVTQNKTASNKKSGSNTNATAIQTSSTKKKSGTTSNTANKKKAANIVSTSKKNSKTKGNTDQAIPKSITYGRPAESYVAEKKVPKKTSSGMTSKSTTKSNSVSLPKATQVPIQKKSTKSNSDSNSNKVKIYEPTNSRSSAGKYSYAKKTSPAGAKEGASFIVSSLPIVGDAKDVQEAITGKDLVTGKKLSNTDRVITAAAIVVPVVSGKSVSTAKKAVKSPAVKKAVKSGTKKLKQSTAEIVKKAKSGLQKTGKEIVDDVKKKVSTETKVDVKIDGGKNGAKVKESGSSFIINSKGVNKADRLKQNRVNGRNFEIESLGKMKESADDVVEQITIKSKSGTRTRLDAIGIDKETGEILIEEYKASSTAPLTKNQKKHILR